MAGPTISADWERHGFFDPLDPDADERQRLLAFYEANGLAAADFAGVDAESLVRVVNQRAVRSGPRVDAQTARAAADLERPLFDELIRVTGYSSDGQGFTEADIETLRLFKVAADFFSEQEMVHFSAVMVSALARVADAAVALFRIDVSPEIDAAGGSELEYAKKNFEAAGIVQLMTRPLWALFALQLELAAERGDRSRSGVAPGANASLLQMGVGFVDLVGFTPLAIEASHGELADFVRDFEQEAAGIISSHSGRLVKLIGDEVMFVAVGAGETVHIANELMQAFARRGIQPHGGVAYGEVIGRGGDYYGSVVNLASRIASLAVPGELLVDDDTAVAASDHTFEPAGRRMIKGFPDPVRLSSLLA